jgi:hypothetical protein
VSHGIARVSGRFLDTGVPVVESPPRTFATRESFPTSMQPTIGDSSYLADCAHGHIVHELLSESAICMPGSDDISADTFAGRALGGRRTFLGQLSL